MKAELVLYREKIRELEKFCRDSSMEYEIFRNRYPMMMRVRATAEYMQLSILEDTRKPVDENATISFTLEGGEAHYKIDDGFSISEKAFNKLKSLFKDIANFYVQYYFRMATTEPRLENEASRILDAIDAEDE